MRRWLLATLLVLLPAVFAAPARAATTGVSIVSVPAGFSPASITINAGDTVKWTNNDATTTHTATSTDSPAAFDSGNLAPGGVGTYSHTFNDPGSYAYRCSIHNQMMGSVFVQGPSTTATTSTIRPGSTTTTAKGTTTSSSVKPTTTSSSIGSSSTSTSEGGTTTSESTTSTSDLVAAGPTKHKGGGATAALLAALALVVAGGGGVAAYRLRRRR